MKILGIKVYGHDTGAAVLDDGRVIAISQERLDRKKYSGSYPREAVDYVLSAAGIRDICDVDLIAIEQWHPTNDKSVALLREHGVWDKISDKAIFVNHHDAHAASAFFCSPFEDAAVLVVDSAGQIARHENGLLGAETESFYRGGKDGLQLFSRNHSPVNQFTNRLINFSGIGNFYSQVTYFLGFGKHEEGKTMGLAPYGQGKFNAAFPESTFTNRISDSRIIFPARLEPHPDTSVRYLFKKGGYSRKAAFKNRLKSLLTLFSGKGLAYEPQNHFNRTPDIFHENPRLEKGIKSPDTLYTELATWAQYHLENTMIGYAAYSHRITQSKNLCIAGGVGLNSVANKKILDSTPFENIFIQPAAGDSGLALGAALWAAHQIKKLPRRWQMDNAYLGKEYSDTEIKNAVRGCHFEKLANPAQTAAKLLAKEKIIGWFQGKSEYGPRALGNRSILCSPIPPGMKDKLNSQVKHRESFRPFAPACPEEVAGDYFELDCPSPFMLLIAKVKKNNIPAVTHIDGTARVQTISKNQNPKFYSLIREFEKLSGVPVVLNTSFNNNGEPIVETPADAIRTFKITNLDALIIGDYLIMQDGLPK